MKSGERSLNFRVLVTEESPSYGVLAAVRALRRASYKPYVASPIRSSYAYHSRAKEAFFEVPDPQKDVQGYIRQLVRQAQAHGIRVILPGTEIGLITLAQYRSYFPAEIAVGTPDVAIVNRTLSKPYVNKVAESIGLRIPPSAVINRGTPVRLSGLEFPVVVKPLRSRTLKADGSFAPGQVQLVTDERGLERALGLAGSQRVLIQQRIPGNLVAVCGVAWGGEVIGSCHQRALRIFPSDNGVSAYAVTIPLNLHLDGGVRRFIERIGWSGIFQVQFIRTREESYLIDFNPRIYGSLSLSVAAGLNLPAIWSALLLGHRPVIKDYQVGTWYRCEERDGAALLCAALRGDFRSMLNLCRGHLNTIHAIFSWQDPLPLFTSFKRLLSEERGRALFRGEIW